MFSLAGYVEALAVRLGMKVPELTPKQADMWQTRVSSHLVSDLPIRPLSSIHFSFHYLSNSFTHPPCSLLMDLSNLIFESSNDIP